MKLPSFEEELTSTSWQLFSNACMQISEKKIFILHSDTNNESFLTGTSLLNRSKLFGSMLQEMPPQTKTILLLPPVNEYIIALLSCWYANLVAIPMAVIDLSKPEQAYMKIKPIIEASQATCIITETSFAEFLEGKAAFNNVRIFNISQMKSENHGYLEPRRQNPEELAMILYTSDFISKSNGVKLSHSYIQSQAHSGAEQWDIGQESRIVSWIFQFHNFGLYFNILTPLLKGATSILLPPDSITKNPELWLKAIGHWSATHTAATNFVFDYCYSNIEVNEISDVSLASLQAIISGGEPIFLETCEKFNIKFKGLGLRKEVFYPHLGLIETKTGRETIKKQIITQNIEFNMDSLSNQILFNFVKEVLLKKLDISLGIDSNELDPDQSFADYGMDSITGIDFIHMVSDDLLVNIDATCVFEHSSVNQMCKYLLSKYKAEILETVKQKNLLDNNFSQIGVQEESVFDKYRNNLGRIGDELNNESISSAYNKEKRDKIAIIGISGRFAKAETPDELWEYLVNGQDLTEEVSRWDITEQCIKDEKYCKRGSFISGLDLFEPLFFNISGFEATYMEPQQRIFLEECWKALEDSGYAGAGIQGKNCGVFVGCTTGDYLELLGEDLPAQAIWGNMNSMIPTRIAYYLDLHGPVIAVDTACSSSLVAIHLACKSLLAEECDTALAGGIYVQCTPKNFNAANKGGILSKTGCCHSFDNRADGFIIGEGAGVVMLKRLSNAVADGDHIYGVISGSAINQDGTTNGITAPSAVAQEQLERYVYDSFDINPEKIQFIETHGTGTKLGDPIEFQALTKTFEHYTDKKNFCALGTIKTNIGHTQLASGVAGVIKVLLSLKNKKIPPALYFDSPNEALRIENSPFYVNTRLQDWVVEQDSKRCAVVSSFGFSGTNAHMVIEEAPELNRQHTPRCGYLIVLSARTFEQLKLQARQLINFCKSTLESDCGNISYTLLNGRKHFNHRLACIAHKPVELAELLKKWLDKGKHSQVYISELNVNDIREQPALKRYGNQCIKDCYYNDGIYLENISVLADLYIQGYKLDFEKLFYKDNYCRISLPTYPFIKERYWPSKTVQNAGDNSPGAFIHPLLQKNVSDFSGIKYSSTFTGKEFFLRDHVVNGEKVLPGAAYLELVRVAAVTAIGGRDPYSTSICIKNVVWTRPITVGQKAETVYLGLKPEETGEISYKVYSETEEGSKDSIVYSEGMIALSSSTNTKTLDLMDIQKNYEQLNFSSIDFYSQMKKLGISYEKSYQCIKEVYKRDGQVLTRLILPASASDSLRQFVMHPCLLDAAFQSISLILSISGNINELKPSLLFALQEVEITGTCSAVMWALISYCDGNSAEDKLPKYDIELYDEKGKLCASIKKASTKIAGGASDACNTVKAKNSSSKLIGNISLLPCWDNVEIEKSQTPPNREGRTLLVSNKEDIEKLVGQYFKAIEILALDPEDKTDDIVKKLEGINCIENLICIITSEVTSDLGNSVIDEQKNGVLFIFRLIKALLLQGHENKEINWTIITCQTQPINKNDRVNPAHASLHGFVGSMAKEYSNWKLRLVDLEAGCKWPMEDILEMAPDLRGNILVYRGNQWYRQHLVQVESVPKESSLYRNEGVYVVIGGAGGIGEAWSECMIKAYNAKIVWIGRRIKNEEIQAKIERLAVIGTEPVYISADAANIASLQEAYSKILKHYPKINGVIHSAQVFLGGGISKIEEDDFGEALASKVNVCINLALVFRKVQLDFMLFFSSINSYLTAPGQSPYSSGCVFEDAFVHQLAQELPYAVKVMNWGYFFNNIKNKARLEQAGIGLIEPEEATAAIDRLLAGDMLQMTFLKNNAPSGMRGMSVSEDMISIHTEDTGINIQGIMGRITTAELPIKQIKKVKVQMQEMEDLLYKMLWCQLQAAGLFGEGVQTVELLKAKVKPNSIFERWLEESLRLFIQKKYIAYGEGKYTVKDSPKADIKDLWKEWELRKAEWSVEAEMRAQAALVEQTIKALPEIITGKKLATEIMFPDSSLEYVEAVYKNNTAGHYFNEVLANTLTACIEARIEQDTEVRLRIIEIGAGTGGTSVVVLKKLQQYSKNIEEYCYTDISKAFLIHAESEYGPENPYLTYKIFNAEKPIAAQGFLGGEYDIVIAANCLHATRNIRETMRNTKAVLKKNGLLLLNELSGNNLFGHLTFGLLDGWWLYEDEKLRIPGCPGLSSENWQILLEEEGFHSFMLPFEKSLNFLQQVIAAQSDGVVRQKQESSSEENKKYVNKTQINKVNEIGKVKEIPSSKQEKKSPSMAYSLEDYVKNSIAQKMSESLKIDAYKIGFDEAMSDYGLDSIIAVNLVRVIGQALNIELDITIMFEYTTINQLAEYILSQYGAEIAAALKLDSKIKEIHEGVAATKSVEANLNTGADWASNIRVLTKTEALVEQKAETNLIKQDSFAIIGISAKFPKSNDVSEYWDNLSNARNCIGEITQERLLDWHNWYSEYKMEIEDMQSKYAGLIDGIAEFDPLFFGISPQEARVMSPELRILLTYIWNAIEDAGITPRALSHASTGVFIAAAASEYKGGKICCDLKDIPQIASNPSSSMMANRISYILNLSGPSECCETGCSSALLALHRAIQAIKEHECDQAIIGAVSLLLSPVGFVGLESLGLLSSQGRVKSFQKDAEGFIRSEGVGAIIIKPLAKAIAEGDRIYAVVKGSAVAHGGKGVSPYAPNASGMKAAMIKAYRTAGIDPRTVSYMEAHGIGAALADSIEANALKSGYQELVNLNLEDSGVGAANCYIGSAKPCIGHGEIASGLAALIKVVMAMQNCVIPGIPGFEAINEDISLDRSNFIFSAENHKWEAIINSRGEKLPRRASINSYGLGGVNAHIVLEEYVTEEASRQINLDSTPQIIVLSARSKERLRALAERMLEYVSIQTKLSLADIAYTLQMGREAMGVRLSMVVGNREELKGALSGYLGRITNIDFKHNPIPLYEVVPGENISGINSLFSGKVGDIVLHALLEEEDLEKLALYWANGNDIPWDALHKGKKLNKIALPTYPFERKRYWIDSDIDTAVQENGLSDFDEYVSEEKAFSNFVVGIFSRLLKIEASEMKLNIPVEQYGVDSIMLMPLLQQLHTAISPEISLTELQECKTIQDVIAMSAVFNTGGKMLHGGSVRRQVKTAWSEFPELIHLNTSTQGQPIFWIHGALGGVEAYKLIGKDIKRPFFGIQARGWMTNHSPLHGIHTMAAYYAHIIQSVQPEGPYDLGGFCLGGILSYEVTRHLQECGQTVNTLVMIDSPDNSFQENMGAYNENVQKNTIFQTVNMMLLSLALQKSESIELKLIHRDELNINVDDEEFFKQINELAKEHGLTKTGSQLENLLKQNVKVQLAYGLDKYKIEPLFEREKIDCFYFRNEGGVFEGNLKPYLTVTDSEMSFDHVVYWEGWKKQFDNFNMMDVYAPNHMMLLNEPESVEKIIALCSKLYSDVK